MSPIGKAIDKPSKPRTRKVPIASGDADTVNNFITRKIAVTTGVTDKRWRLPDLRIWTGFFHLWMSERISNHLQVCVFRQSSAKSVYSGRSWLPTWTCMPQNRLKTRLEVFTFAANYRYINSMASTLINNWTWPMVKLISVFSSLDGWIGFGSPVSVRSNSTWRWDSCLFKSNHWPSYCYHNPLVCSVKWDDYLCWPTCANGWQLLCSYGELSYWRCWECCLRCYTSFKAGAIGQVCWSIWASTGSKSTVNRFGKYNRFWYIAAASAEIRSDSTASDYM